VENKKANKVSWIDINTKLISLKFNFIFNMGNQPSSTSSKRRGSRKSQTTAEQAAEHAKRVVGNLQEGLKKSVKKLDDDHPAAQLLDHVCGTYYHDDEKYRNSRSASYYSEETSEDGSRTFQSEDHTTYDGRIGRKSDKSVDSQSCFTQSDYDSDSRRRGRVRGGSFDTEDESRVTHETEPKLISKPLASSFAKRCYFTKSGIGKTTQHYEGLTLTGNVVLMLASAMKLKGCPTICDEDLRRVEQTFPNQFSRLPDELLLSSGWRRISKYCHFSNKSVPDGIPFFHSKQRLHPSGGYYFLLAGSVGMIRPIDVEPLTKDTLVLLETDFPNQCDAAPSVLIQDPVQWVLVNKFCFFSGGPINTEEDVYYQADFDGNPIFMLAFLSPSLTPEELYKLTEVGPENEPGLKSVVDVQEVESVYDLTERDFDDLKLYHLGPCRALPQYILQPSAWTKVLPPHFLAARQQAMMRAQDYDERFEEGIASATQTIEFEVGQTPLTTTADLEHPFVEAHKSSAFEEETLQHEAEQEDAFQGNISPEYDAPVNHPNYSTRVEHSETNTSRIDPPDDEPPSLKIESMEENENPSSQYLSQDDNPASSPSGKPEVDDQGFFMMEPALELDEQDGVDGSRIFSSEYASPGSKSRHRQDQLEGFANGSEGLVEEPPETDNSQFSIHFKSPSAESPRDENFYYSDEKKMGMEKDELSSAFHDSKEERAKSGTASTNDQPYNDIEPIDITYTKPSLNLSSQAGVSTNSGMEKGHQSPALRGAHEILKRNRRRRADPSTSNKSYVRNPTSPTKSENPGSTRSEMSTNTWDENGADINGSAVSGSSGLSESSGASERSSRRALILQMAKARMKNNKESPVKTSSAMIHDDEADILITEGNATLATHDFDLTDDLD